MIDLTCPFTLSPGSLPWLTLGPARRRSAGGGQTPSRWREGPPGEERVLWEGGAHGGWD